MKPYSCEEPVIHPDAVEDTVAALLPQENYDRVAIFFKVLGDPTRVKLLWALQRREMCVCDLAAVLGTSKSAVSHHLSLLRHADLVRFRRDGKTVFYALADEHVEGMLSAGLEHIHE